VEVDVDDVGEGAAVVVDPVDDDELDVLDGAATCLVVLLSTRWTT
jgi:hypothetical protein